MKKTLYVIGTLLLAVLVVFIFTNSSNKIPVKQQLKKLELKNVNKLMIVAHPDDETIWGGANLIKDNYLVVCITCGTNRVRVEEIKNALDYSNDKLLMLDYPDKVMGKRSNWKSERKQIRKDLRTVLEYKDWDLVITHNPDGEYGHQHHKITSSMVTELYGKRDNLYYFGKYYTKKEIDKLKPEVTLNKTLLKRKTKDMLPIYRSQDFINDKFGQMYPYENWIVSTEW